MLGEHNALKRANTSLAVYMQNVLFLQNPISLDSLGYLCSTVKFRKKNRKPSKLADSAELPIEIKVIEQCNFEKQNL